MAPASSHRNRVASSSNTAAPVKNYSAKKRFEHDSQDDAPMEVADDELDDDEASDSHDEDSNKQKQTISQVANDTAGEDAAVCAQKHFENASFSDLRGKINFYLLDIEKNGVKFTGMNNRARLQTLLQDYYELSKKVTRTREMVLEGKLLDSILSVCVQCLAGVSQTWSLDDFIQRTGRRLYGSDYDGNDVDLQHMRPKAFERMHSALNACAARDPCLEGVQCLFGRMNLMHAPLPPKERRKIVREKFEKVEKQPGRMKGQTAEAKEEEAVVKRVEKLRERIVQTYRDMKKQPMSFWHLIIDVDSFENSVQSLFLFLYLCKEGFLIINFDEDPDWPSLVPISDDAGIDAAAINEKLTQQHAEDFHWMPTFTMPKWQAYSNAIRGLPSSCNEPGPDETSTELE